jgi:methylmalonyl-CoA mutase
MSTRKDTLIGVNKSPNINETIHESLKFDYNKFSIERIKEIALHISSRDNVKLNSIIDSLKTETDSDKVFAGTQSASLAGAVLDELVSSMCSCVLEEYTTTPIARFRASEHFEELRTNASNYKSKNGFYPKIFLVNMGPLRQYKARADFASDFFQVAGFEPIYPLGFESVESASKAAIESGIDIIVICSTDDTYPEIVPELTKSLKAANKKAKIIVAGYPSEYIETFKQAGVDDFIHVKANNYEVLSGLQKAIGIS